MQTRLESAVEITVATSIRFVVNYLIGMVIYPLFGFDVTKTDLGYIVIIFTISSLLLSYAMRRWFNGRLVRRMAN